VAGKGFLWHETDPVGAVHSIYVLGYPPQYPTQLDVSIVIMSSKLTSEGDSRAFIKSIRRAYRMIPSLTTWLQLNGNVQPPLNYF
jgi:hypothetical protein